MDENKRLSDLTRMLLSSPSFSNFLDHLSVNPTTVPTVPIKTEHQQQQLQQPNQQQASKDASPHNSQQSQQQIGMAMIPEQNMDFSMLSLANNPYNFQPQVFVVDTPEAPTIDTSVLSGKTSNFVEPLMEADEDKVEIPAIERPSNEDKPASVESLPVDEEFENDPEFALYHSEPAKAVAEPTQELDTDGLSHIDIFGGIESEKVLSRYELVDASEEEANAIIAMARVQRMSENMESVVSRLEMLTMDL